MKNIVAFSGGKDSTATAIWAKENFDDFDLIFCDTGWEHEFTYKFVEDFSKEIGIPIRVIRSKKYFDNSPINFLVGEHPLYRVDSKEDGFYNMTLHKKRVASSMARFCTEELKVKVMIDYILDHTDGDVTIYQGVRHQESYNRSFLSPTDDYFLNYHEPYKIKEVNGKLKEYYHTYRKKDVMALDREVIVKRPILKWTHDEVFKYITENGYSYNPLYDFGMHRVGCFPRVMVNQQEFWAIIKEFPETVDKVRELEEATGRSFFTPKYIPPKHHDKEMIKEDGTVVTYPSVDAVVKYLKQKHATMDMFKPIGVCKNIYVPCE